MYIKRSELQKLKNSEEYKRINESFRKVVKLYIGTKMINKNFGAKIYTIQNYI